MAKRTIGFSGADLKNICNIAVIRAIKMNKSSAGF